jgi:penicillin amidase
MDLPKEKLERILNPSSPLDVLLIGKDEESSKCKVQSSKFNDKRVETWNPELGTVLSKAEEIRKNSLERIGFYAEDLAASNNWVISGKRTIDGKPLLANDPHLRPTQPPIWYMVHLNLPDAKFAGVTTAGIPGIIIGHNEHIAWGFTNVGPDVQDLYLETFDASGKYKTPTGWATPTVRREEIKVRKNQFSTETETEVLEVVNTRNGVIFFEDGAKRYALKWTAFDAKNDSLKALSMLTKARNWKDFQNALRNYSGAMQNFVYADDAGNIGWIAAGRIPIRKTGDGSLPYNGATNEGEWTGFIPFEELPQLFNPPEGFITTANQRTVGKSYKYHDLIARAHSPGRARRLYYLLSSNTKVSIDDVRDFQFDTFSVVNSQFAREVVNLKGASNETLKLFAGWNGRMNADSKAALVADAMRSEFRNKILVGNFGAERARNFSLPYDTAFFDWIITEKPKEWLPKEFASYDALLKTSETQARANLTKQLGGDESKWAWGAIAKTNFSHPLAIAPLIGGQFAIEAFPQNGSGGAAASPNVGAAVSMRFIATPGNWDLTRQVLPTGESGDPKSAHYRDQIDAWRTGNTPVFPFTKTAVEMAAKEVVMMTPK